MNHLAVDQSYKDAYTQRRARLGMPQRAVQRVFVQRAAPEPLMLEAPPVASVPAEWMMGPVPVAVCAEPQMETNMDMSVFKINSQWKRIVLEVCSKHGISWLEIRSKHRNQTVVKARYEAFYRLRTETAMSYPQMASRMGGFDHTIAIRGYEMHKAFLEGRVYIRGVKP